MTGPYGANDRQLVSCVADVMVMVTHNCADVLPYGSGGMVIVDGLTVPPFVVASVTDVNGMAKAALAVLVFFTAKQYRKVRAVADSETQLMVGSTI